MTNIAKIGKPGTKIYIYKNLFFEEIKEVGKLRKPVSVYLDELSKKVYSSFYTVI